MNSRSHRKRGMWYLAMLLLIVGGYILADRNTMFRDLLDAAVSRRV